MVLLNESDLGGISWVSTPACTSALGKCGKHCG